MTPFVFDTSSAILAWNNYPSENFPRFWDWFAEKITNGEMALPQDAKDEINRISPECGEWLKEQNIKIIPLSDMIVHEAMRIKEMLDISNDNYHNAGVGENDIHIIATAKIPDRTLISDEARQPTLPDDKRKYKIPSVCLLPEISVSCVNLVSLIKNSEKIFG